MTTGKYNHNGHTDRMRAALHDLGPMTATEMCEQLGMGRKSFHALMRRMRLHGEAHIKKYVESDTSTRTTPVALYAAGPGRDAPKPKAQSRIAVKRRYDEKVKSQNRTNSVFNLALPRHKYRVKVSRSAIARQAQ